MADKIEYRGYIYDYEDDYEEDNIKRFHDCYCEHDGIRVHISMVPLSPYAKMNQGLWEMWIQAGRPTREMMGGHHPEDIQKFWRGLYEQAIDDILLGKSND